MAINSKNILQKGHSINDKYQVTFFLKKGSYAETYRVKGKQGKTQKCTYMHVKQILQKLLVPLIN